MHVEKGDPAGRPFFLALAGLAALAVAMGVGRFAFTPLLPLMQADAGLTLGEGSWLAFANYLGYLIGALATVWLRFAPHRMARAGLAATGVLTLAVALVDGFVAWWVLRFASGVASAMVLVYGSAMTLERLARAGRPELFGFAFGGVGVGITVTGLACLALSAAGYDSSAIWFAFGLASLAVCVLCWGTFAPLPLAAAQGAASAPERTRRWGAPAWILIVAYGLYGFGYIIPGTFMPVMARDLLGGAFVSGGFWPLFGIAAFTGTLLTGRFSGGGQVAALVGCYFIEALGVIVPVIWPNTAGLALGSLLLGTAFVAITMLTLRVARAMTADTPAEAAPLMGALTAAFGLGQLVGPPFAHALVARFGSFDPSLVVASAGLAVGGVALWIMLR